MAHQWRLIGDVKDMKKGFLRIERDGVRVVDAFPFAIGARPEWIAARAKEIVECMNRFEREKEEIAQANDYNNKIADSNDGPQP